MTLNLKLTTPIKVAQIGEGQGPGEISEIIFRKPNADDFFECGLPGRQIQNFDSANKLTSIEVIVDQKAIKAYAMALAQPRRTPSELGQMDISDLRQFWEWLGNQINPSGN